MRQSTRFTAEAPPTIARVGMGWRVLTARCSATAVFLAAAPISSLPDVSCL
jgi:hypothetical protein